MRLPIAALLLSAAAWLPHHAQAADHQAPCPDAIPASLFADSVCTIATLPLRHEAPEDDAIEVFVRRVPPSMQPVVAARSG